MKKSLLLLSTGFLSLLLLLSVYNLRLDRWAVFSEDYQSFYADLEFNYHYLKTRYVLDDPGRFDCFVFGSSRVASLDADRLGQREGLRCYNFTHSGGTPVQHLHDLQLFLAAGVSPARIYIGVDDLAYTWDNRQNDRHFGRRSYPSSLADWFGFYAMYLLRLPDEDDLAIWQGKHETRAQPWWVLSDGADGLEDNRALAEELFNDPGGQRQKFAGLGPTLWYQDDNVSQTLEALQAIRELAQAHEFEVEVFFNPMHYKTYLANDWELLQGFKQGLAGQDSYYDFSGFNEVTMDDRYWMETSHYSTLAGDRMIASLAGLPGVAGVEARFGRRSDARRQQQYFAEDTRRAAALFPGILREQKGMYLPVPVAGHLWQSADPEDLLQPALLRPGTDTIMNLDSDGVEIVARSKDPQLRIEPVSWPGGQFAVLELEISVPETGWAELYFAARDGKFRRKQSQLFRTRPGRNRLLVPLWPEQDLGRLRLDPGRRPGQYRVHELQLHRIQLPEQTP
jgi:hypothetical protein